MTKTLTPREPRQPVLLPAKMRSDSGQADVCIRNISSRGMLLQAANAPERGAYIEILRPRHSITARVVWSKGRRFGIHSRERIDLDDMLERRDPDRAGGGKAPLIQTARRRRLPPVAASTADASRRLSSMIQYGVMAAVGTAGAIAIGATVYATLAHAVLRIASNLD